MMYVDARRTPLRRVLPATFSLTPGQKPKLTPALRRRSPGQPPAAYFFVLLLLSGLLLPVATQTAPSQSQAPSSFYSYGKDAGDNTTENSDDGGSGKITLDQAFPFFGKKHDKLYVNNNGVISFIQNLRTYRPEDFPLRNKTIIAPYWADVDVQVGGRVWYRKTADPKILSRANDDVHNSGYKRFKGTWAFIATWDEVGFYGAMQEGRDRRNSFQCVLVYDATESFVIINYGQIEWTTGSNSQGDTHTGLGGNPAQAGFNAGDGVNYLEIEGARTDAVINLTRTSNVCIPGRWIFRVDSKGIKSDSGGLYFIPSFGSMLGGYQVAITGPCFDAVTSSIQGLIVDTNTSFPCVKDSKTGSRAVLCVMPTMYSVGSATISILVDGQMWNYTGVFVFENPGLLEAKVRRINPNSWMFGGAPGSVSWNSSLFPDHKQVLVELMEYRDLDGQPQLISAAEPVNGNNTLLNKFNKVALPLPRRTETTLAVIRVKVPHTLINGSYLSHWSDVFPVRWSNDVMSAEWCSAWLSQEQSRGELKPQAACPCTLSQAESDTGRWRKDPLCFRGSPASYNCLYRGSNTHECIVPTFGGSESGNQRCCYKTNDELLDMREGGGGSMLERYHFLSRGDQIVPWFSYLSEDVAPFLHCCEYFSNVSLCEKFQEKRLPVTCQGYNPPAAAQAAGDPHIVTLDGVGYTFNGVGDYVLLQDVSGRVRVHVHAARAVDIDGQLGNATVFTAVAMSVVNETDVVEIQKDVAKDTVAVLVNQQEVDFTSTQQELRGMTIYHNETSNSTVEFTIVMDTAGISVLVSATQDLLNIMVLVGASELKGNLRGLLGNYNGVKEDDFQSHSGQQVPITANMSDVHYHFGMTWYLQSNETLLYHPDTGEDSTESAESDYAPVFIGSLKDDELRNGTLELCQGNLQCIFDFQLTGKESIGQSTKQFNDRFESVVNEIAPVVRCPYVSHIANGNRTLEGQRLGNKVYFSCNEGFIPINGSTTLVCQENGQWSSTGPDCVEDLSKDSLPLLYISIGGAVGGFLFVIVCALLIRCAVIRCQRKYVPKNPETGSEPEQFELPRLFHPSEEPNPVFENPLFLTSLDKLRSEEGRFQIPRPRYVDPNIYTEYF